jgi:hypothetical protein
MVASCEKDAVSLFEINLEANVTDVNRIIGDLVRGAGGEDIEVTPPELSSGGDVLTHSFQVGLPLGTARVKLGEVLRHLYARNIREDENGCSFRLALTGRFWQQWLGREPALEVRIELLRVNPMSVTPVEVRTQIRTLHCNPKRRLELFESTGASVLESLQQHMLVNSEKRMQERLLWPEALIVIPINSAGEREEPIECRGKDLSRTGIGFFLPHELHTSHVLIELPNTICPPVISVPATLVRAKRCADGWYEVGAIFQLAPLRRSLAEMRI